MVFSMIITLLFQNKVYYKINFNIDKESNFDNTRTSNAIRTHYFNMCLGTQLNQSAPTLWTCKTAFFVVMHFRPLNQRSFWAEQTFGMLGWPSQSPRLSPIKHLRDMLGLRARRRADIRNLVQLEAVLIEEYNTILQEKVTTLIWSMRRRILACCEAVGDHNRY